jgi:S-adenosylmethionine hydrolase
MTRPERPVIGFLTDFGLDGAAATCRAVMLSICRDAQIVDIAHTIRKYAIRDGAFVLRAALPYFPVGVHLAVVDPGVGTERRPIALRVDRGDVLVGPDNGLLVPAADVLGGVIEVRELTNRDLWLPVTTSTFHGRDIFAPVAARLAAAGTTFEEVGPAIGLDEFVRLPEAEATVDDGAFMTEVLYVDSFGNLRLAGSADQVMQAVGMLEPGARIRVELLDGTANFDARIARSFGGVAPGARLLYVDSSGNPALATSQGDLASELDIGTGARLIIRPA